MRRANEILPGVLYQASHPKKWPEGKVAWMNENVDLVIVLAGQPDVELDELAAAEQLNFTYWHFPVVDSHKTVDERIGETVVPAIADWIRAGKRVLVCCLAGRSRSGAASTLAVRELYNVSGADALAYVRTKRKNAVKREGPTAYLNSLERPRPEDEQAELPS